MALCAASRGWWLVAIGLCLALLPGQAAAFGAGNIPSIAQVSDHLYGAGLPENTNSLMRRHRLKATTGDMEVRALDAPMAGYLRLDKLLTPCYRHRGYADDHCFPEWQKMDFNAYQARLLRQLAS
jgi:hypothetical protein